MYQAIVFLPLLGAILAGLIMAGMFIPKSSDRTLRILRLVVQIPLALTFLYLASGGRSVLGVACIAGLCSAAAIGFAAIASALITRSTLRRGDRS